MGQFHEVSGEGEYVAEARSDSGRASGAPEQGVVRENACLISRQLQPQGRLSG